MISAGASRTRVVVAMSGGVDSSVAAALLCEQGLDVVGVTLKLYDAAGAAASAGGRCCTPRDIEDARATAAHLGIPHYVIDEREAFAAGVVDDFVEEYRAGRTPSPCVRCNERLKFGPLLRVARALGAEALATGHYARLDRDDAGLRLRRALDRDKDQAYFLFAVRPAWLAQVRVPVGNLRKDEVRAIAARLALPNRDKPDSQQLCFVPDGDHLAFLSARGGGKPGVIVDERGVALAPHAGTHHFTVGQRKRLPAAAGPPRFVVRIDAATGTVHTGPREHLGRSAMRVRDVRWLRPAPADGAPLRCAVQVRHHAAAHPATVHRKGAHAVVELDRPVEAIAPGQAAVFFDDDTVLGGGWID